MSVTDNPLKRLFNAFAKEIAAWLLNAEVQTVSDSLNVEISARNLSVDQVGVFCPFPPKGAFES